MLCSCGVNNAINLEPNGKIVGDVNDNLKYDYAGKFNQQDIDFLKETFDWTNDVIVINYTLPEENCTIAIKKPNDPKDRFERARNWWNPFYNAIDLMDSRVVHVEASEKYGKAFGSYTTQYYWDEKGFLLDHFYRNARGCEAVLVVNRDGQFYQQNDYYSKEQVAFYIAKLKSSIIEL